MSILKLCKIVILLTIKTSFPLPVCLAWAQCMAQGGIFCYNNRQGQRETLCCEEKMMGPTKKLGWFYHL